MNIDLDRISQVASGSSPEALLASERITKKEVTPSTLERVNRAIKRIPQIKGRTDVDRGGKSVELDLGGVVLKLDFQTGRFTARESA